MTEEHLARLLGEGIHPVTGGKLGKRFPSFPPPRERIAARVARHEIRPIIHETFPLDQIQRAHEVFAGCGVDGKLVVTV